MVNNNKTKYKPLVPAVEQSCRVLLCLTKGDKFHKTLTDIYQDVGISKSKAFTILNTLIKFNLVEKHAQTKTYSVGPGLIALSRYFLDNLSYTEIVSPYIEELARATTGTALFGIITGEHVFVIAKHEEHEVIGLTIRVGHRFHITIGSIGKCIVPFLPKTARDRILASKKLYFYGNTSPLDRNRLQNEFDKCKQKGYSVDIGEVTPGINFTSAPVFNSNDEITGCVILLGTFPASLIEDYGLKTASIGQQISHRLGASLKNMFNDQ